MNIRKKLNNQIKRKLQDIERLEKDLQDIQIEIREAKAYIQAIEDALKHLPKEGEESEEISIRPGSSIDKVMKILREEGNSLYIESILERMGREINKQGRQALSGQLSNYVRQKRIFSRTAPNTFGLLEWESETSSDDENPEIPVGFGEIRTIK